MRLFQAPGQLGGPRGVGASAAGGVSCSAGGAFPPEEDPIGCLPAAPHPAPVHAGGTFFILAQSFRTSSQHRVNAPHLCVCAGDRGDGRLEAGPTETVPGLLCREASITTASRCQPRQAVPGQASIGPVTASRG